MLRGADVLHLGVAPTPAVAFLTVEMGADAGIVISASHNPFEHNGIKIFNSQGYKLRDALEGEIEEIILSGQLPALKTHGDLGRVIHKDEEETRAYIDHLVSTVDTDFAGMRIVVDCANGAASATAPGLFARFPKLHADILHAQPDGININNGCGSTHMEDLKAAVVKGGYDLGLAYDGDADRFLAVDEKGEDIDGDQIMAACARVLQAEGKLNGNAMVGTVMSNMGLHIFAKENGMELHCTPVGDRNVLEKMLEHDFVIGESSPATPFSAPMPPPATGSSPPSSSSRCSTARARRPLSWWPTAAGIPRSSSTSRWRARRRRRPSWPPRPSRTPSRPRRPPFRGPAASWCAPPEPRPSSASWWRHRPRRPPAPARRNW